MKLVSDERWYVLLLHHWVPYWLQQHNQQSQLPTTAHAKNVPSDMPDVGKLRHSESLWSSSVEIWWLECLSTHGVMCVPARLWTSNGSQAAGTYINEKMLRWCHRAAQGLLQRIQSNPFCRCQEKSRTVHCRAANEWDETSFNSSSQCRRNCGQVHPCAK